MFFAHSFGINLKLPNKRTNDVKSRMWILLDFEGDITVINNKYPINDSKRNAIASISIRRLSEINSVVMQNIAVPPMNAYDLDNSSASTNTRNDKNIVPNNKMATAVFKIHAIL